MSQVTKRNKKDVSKGKVEENNLEKDKNKIDEKDKPKYGPILKIPYQRIWSRCVLIIGVMIVVWYNSKNNKEIILAKQKDVLLSKSQNLECSKEFKADIYSFPECISEKCGRVVTDKIVTNSEADVLLNIAQNACELSESNGGAKVFDLHSGALTMRNSFINIYELKDSNKVLNSADFAVFKVVKTKIQHAIAHHFGINADHIFLTKPTFFSIMTNVSPKTIHDEYWHPHIDKNTYESFHYTSILYLSDYNHQFQGGRFIFIDKNSNSTIEPRKGRVSMFTSGSENTHVVERVTSGTRYALTVPFTCDQRLGIPDPYFKKPKKL